MAKATPPATASRNRYPANELPLRGPSGVEELQSRPRRLGRVQREIRRVQMLDREIADAVAAKKRNHAVDLAAEQGNRPPRALFATGRNAVERGAADHDRLRSHGERLDHVGAAP